MSITTIQLPLALKKELDLLKEKPTQSYAEVIAKLIRVEKKKKIALNMMEYARKYGEESRKEVNEWIDDPWD